MADGGAQGDGFWLPAEFFDDFVTDEKNSATNENADLIFPSEFPYELQTLVDVNFGKRWGMSTSPQSTLAGGGVWSAGSAGGTSSNGSSPNGVYSPPTSPVGDITDLIYRAADQVAKMKLNVTSPGADQVTKAVVAPRNSNQFHHLSPKCSNQTAFRNIHLQLQKQGTSRVWYGEPQMHQIRSTVMAMEAPIGPQPWPHRYSPTPISSSGARDAPLSGSIGGAAPKRGRTGTGVFIPRRYDGSSFSSDSRRKMGSYVPGRNPTGNHQEINGFAQSRPQFHGKPINRGFVSNYDLLLARRNALLLQQSRSVLLGRPSPSPMPLGTCLPQEWSY